jgi:MFS family permease
MATMIGIVGGLHYGVGRAAGSMVGGALMSIFNARIAFRIFGILAGVVAVIYAAIYYIFIRRGEIKNLEQKSKETKNIDENNVMLNVKLHPNDNQKSNGDINTNTSISLYDINEIEEIPRKERCNSITSTISHISANLAIAHPI